MVWAFPAPLFLNPNNQPRVILDQHVILLQNDMTMAVLRKVVHRNHVVDTALSRQIGRDWGAGEYGSACFRSFLDVEVSGHSPVWSCSNADKRESREESDGEMACRHMKAPDQFGPEQPN